VDFKTYISKNESCWEGKSKRKTEGLVVLIRYVFILSELMLKKTKEVLTGKMFEKKTLTTKKLINMLSTKISRSFI